MTLPPQIDAKIRQRFDDLINDAQFIIRKMDQDNNEGHQRMRASGIAYAGEIQYQDEAYQELLTKTMTLIKLVLGNTERSHEIATDLKSLKCNSTSVQKLRGILRGLKTDYSDGMLEALDDLIEANVASDYMGQAEQLLGEGIIGQHDYVPAAVLTGAVLERSLRTLCLKQSPQISLTNPNGSPKTLDPLIADLQKANVFNKAKADLLRSWAKTRNSAAHGEFSQFNRNDVELMIIGVKTFLADYL